MIYYEGDHVMIRDAITSDIHRLAADIRPQDTIEVYRSHGHTPAQALAYSFSVSKVKCTIVYRGKPVAMFGLAPEDPNGNKSSVWLLGGNGLAEMWIAFLRLSPIFIDWMLEQYPVLYNFVDAENEPSIRWLKWCGARFTAPAPYGMCGRLFRYFEIQKEKDYVQPGVSRHRHPSRLGPL